MLARELTEMEESAWPDEVDLGSLQAYFCQVSPDNDKIHRRIVLSRQCNGRRRLSYKWSLIIVSKAIISLGYVTNIHANGSFQFFPLKVGIEDTHVLRAY
jgi:hypothetical protein